MLHPHLTSNPPSSLKCLAALYYRVKLHPKSIAAREADIKIAKLHLRRKEAAGILDGIPGGQRGGLNSSIGGVGSAAIRSDMLLRETECCRVLYLVDPLQQSLRWN